MDRKTFDNFLLRIGSEAVPAGRQGVERRIPFGLVEDLLLASELSESLGVPAREAFTISRRLLGRSPGDEHDDASHDFVGSMKVGHFVQLGADLAMLRHEMQRRYEQAVETVVRPVRGRPAKRRTTIPTQADY